MRIRTCLLFIFLATVPVFAQLQKKNIALTHVNLFNGTENKILPDATILIKDGKIEKILKAQETYTGNYEVIDCRGYYVMPGMMDVHTHVQSLEQARTALQSGVTTIRTAGVDAYQDVSLRELSKTGRIMGPDVIPAGTYVTPQLTETVLSDPRMANLINGVNSDEELKQIVNINIDRGALVIKTRGTERAGLPDTDPRQQAYSQHQLEVIVKEAARRQVPVMVHAHGDEGARAAVKAGCKSIEHGTFLTNETLQLMKEKGTYLVPTFITLEDLAKPNGDYGGAVLEMRGRFMVPIGERMVQQAMKTGVKMATGADTNYDAKSTSRVSMECEHYVRLGMPNFQALQTTTVNSADLLGISQMTGRIEPGFEADIIVLPANPLEDIRALQDVLVVISNGHVAMKRIPFGKD